MNATCADPQQTPGQDDPPFSLDHFLRGGIMGELLGMGPEHYKAVYAVGHGMYVQGRFKEAAEVFGQLVMHNHRDRDYIMAYAAALQMAGDCADAAMLYTVLALLEPGNPRALLHCSECLVRLGKKQEAIAGLAVVIKQSTGTQHAALGARAQALHALLSAPLSTPTEIQP